MGKDLSYFKNEDSKFSGDRIVLRAIQEKNIKDCIKWLSDPEVNKFLSHNIKNISEEQELEWLNYINSSSTDIVFAITIKESGRYIGNCGLHKVNMSQKICEFGIFIGDKKYWNKGLGTDTVKTTSNFAISELGLNTIRLTVYEYNHRAISVYKNCGFDTVEILKKHHFYDDVYWDAFVMEYNAGQSSI